MAKTTQFDLLTLAEWILGIAVLAAAMSGCQKNVEYHYNFKILPADISSLKEWAQEEVSEDAKVWINEEEGRIYLSYPQSILSSAFDAATPPWKEFGFGYPNGFGFSSSEQLFKFTPPIIISAVLFSIVFAIARRRNAKTKLEPQNR